MGEMDDADLDQEDFDDDDSYSDEEKPAPKKGRGSVSKKITPINMESQEKIKLERKRMRNRLAASKCRKRKLERISQLELKDLKGENSELYNVVKKLKQSVANLKQEVIDHCNSGCQINGDVLNFSTS